MTNSNIEVCVGSASSHDLNYSEKEKSMTFQLEFIKPGDVLENSLEYRKVLELSKGVRIYRRLFSEANKASLYCLTVSSNEEFPPGQYVLFADDCVVKILAHEKWQDITGEFQKQIVTYIIRSVELVDGEAKDRERICRLIELALKSRSLSEPLVKDVNVQFLAVKGN